MPPSLASRLLFHASKPPPLVTSPELTAELYDLIALALRAYVSPWWSKLTRYDRDLLPHITAIVAHVLRVLDHRIQTQHTAPLVFHDAPAIITQHYIDYRNAQSKMHTSYATGGALSVPALFAQLQPHMAITPAGVLDREYYRHIIDRILAICLPAEDYEPESERIIIREVLLRLLIDDILPRVTQPWFIQKSILDLIGDQDEPMYSAPPPAATAPAPAFTFHALIILALSALQSFSSACLTLIDAYKHTLKLIHQSPPSEPPASAPPLLPPDPLPPSTAPRATPSLLSAPSTSSSVASIPPTTPITPHTPSFTHSTPSQDYAHPPLLLLAALVDAPTRLSTTATLHTAHVLAAAFGPLLDRLLPAALDDLLSPARVLGVVRAGKRALFPNGYPGPTPPDPTPEEQAALRARVTALRPPGAFALLTPLLLGPDPAATLGTALDPLSDAQCNLRLAVFLLDRVLVGLFPELAGGP